MGPLRIIKQLCELIHMQARYNPKFVNAISQGAKFIENNVVNILDFSLFQNDANINLHLEEFNIEDALEEVV